MGSVEFNLNENHKCEICGKKADWFYVVTHIFGDFSARVLCHKHFRMEKKYGWFKVRTREGGYQE